MPDPWYLRGRSRSSGSFTYFDDARFSVGPGQPSSAPNGWTHYDTTAGELFARVARTWEQISGVQSGTSFPGSPAEGQQYYRTDLEEWFFYDSSRSKWLSLRTWQLHGASDANLGAGAYLAAFGFTTATPINFGTAIGMYQPFPVICVEMMAIVGIASTCTFVVRDDGTNVTGATLTVTSPALKANDGTLNSSTIAANSVISLGISSGTMKAGLCYATFRRVAT